MLEVSNGAAAVTDMDVTLMLIMNSHQHTGSVKTSFSESHSSGMEFGKAVCNFLSFFIFFLSPCVAADGAPLPGDTDRDTKT